MKMKATMRPRALLIGTVPALVLAGSMFGGGVATASPLAPSAPTVQCNNDPGFDSSNDPRNTHCPSTRASGPSGSHGGADYNGHGGDGSGYNGHGGYGGGYNGHGGRSGGYNGHGGYGGPHG